MCDQPPVPFRTVTLPAGLSVAALLLAVLLAGCRNVAPIAPATEAAPVASTPAGPAPQEQAVPPKAATAPPPMWTPTATQTPHAAPFRLDLPPGWELAAPVEGYAFTALWRATVASAPAASATAASATAAIAAALLVPADGLDLPSFLDATASELQRIDGATLLSAEVDGRLRDDGRPAGLLLYTPARHEQLGDPPHGRQYMLAVPTAHAFIALTCLVSAQAPRDAAQLCDALANAIVCD